MHYDLWLADSSITRLTFISKKKKKKTGKTGRFQEFLPISNHSASGGHHA
jgi:hypothetical protein